MAYITGTDEALDTTGTVLTCKIPPSVQNDVVILWICFRYGPTVTSVVGNNGGTWTSEAVETGGEDIHAYSCVQGATPDTEVTLTAGSSSRKMMFTMNIRGADGTTPVEVYNSGTTNTLGAECPSVTPTSTNSLILMCVNSRYKCTRPPEGCEIHNTIQDSYEHSVTTASTSWQAASATGAYAFGFPSTGAITNTGMTLAIKDNSVGVKGYADLTSPPFEYVTYMGVSDGLLGASTIYDPTSVSNENLSSISNGSYTTSSLTYDSSRQTVVGEVEVGYDNRILRYTGGSPDTLIQASTITETHGIQDDLDLSAEILITNSVSGSPNFQGESSIGAALGLSDGTNCTFWQLPTSNSIPTGHSGFFPSIIDVSDAAYQMDTSGTLDDANVSGFILVAQPTVAYAAFKYAPILKMKTFNIVGGSSTVPANFSSVYDIVKRGMINTVQAQGGLADGQFLVAHHTQCGGSEVCYWDSTNQSVEWPAAYDGAGKKRNFKLGAGVLNHTIAPYTGSTVVYDSTTLNFGNFHNFILNSGAVSISSDGLNVLTANVTLTAHSGAVSGISFIGCKEISGLVDLSGGNTISNCVDTVAITATSEADFAKLANCTFSGNNRAIQITGNQSHTGSGWADPNLTVSGNTYDIEYTGTTDFSIQSANTLTVNNSSTGTLSIVTPVLTLDINSDTASTLIRYFEDDSQTVVDSATGTTLAYNYPDTDVIDIEFVKQSYVPVNRQDVTPYDGDYDVIMDFDEAYNSSHGLTITTEYDYVRATKVLTINSDQSALDVRSALADVIRTNSGYYNTPLLMVAIPGLTRVDLTDGMSVTAMTTWKGAGVEKFVSASATNPVEKWAAIKSVGDITGATTHYRQTDSGDSTALTLTNNVVDEALQYWDDPDYDGTPATDTSDYLVIKAFLAGSKQARVDVLANAGISALASNLYTVPLANAAHDYSGTDPGITADITLIAGGTVGGKTFAYEIVDGGVNTGEDIADQLNYNAANNPNTVISGGTGLRYFELADMVIHNGTSVETERGYREGATPALVGFYCSRSSADHPDFTRFQADDGTYYTPAVTSNISITGMPTAGNEIRLQIHNETAKTASDWAATTAYSQGDKVLRTSGIGSEHTAGLYFVATTAGTSSGSEPTWDTTVGNTTADGTVTWTTYAILYYDDDPVSTGYADSYTDGEEFSDGDTYRVRFAEINTATSFKTYETTGFAGSTGFTVAVSVDSDSVYAANAVDGSSTAVTDKFTADYTNDEIDLDANQDFAITEAFAYFCYELTTTSGMYEFWGGVTAIDSANYRNNTATVSIYFDETAGFVKQTDSARWFRDDDTRPVLDPTTGGAGLEINWRNPVYQLETGVSGLTGSESTELFKNSTILSNTADIESKVDIIDANVDQIETAVITNAAGVDISADIAANQATSDSILTNTGTTIPDQITALNDFDPANDIVEGTETFTESMRLIRASAAGAIDDDGASSAIIKSGDGLKDRINATYDSDGSRTINSTDKT